MPQDPYDVFDMIADIMRARDEKWREQAACRDSSPRVFFPSETGRTVAAPARRICARCEVQTQCEASFYKMPPPQQLHGIWFGTVERERRGRKKERKSADDLQTITPREYNRSTNRMSPQETSDAELRRMGDERTPVVQLGRRDDGTLFRLWGVPEQPPDLLGVEVPDVGLFGSA